MFQVDYKINQIPTQFQEKRFSLFGNASLLARLTFALSCCTFCCTDNNVSISDDIKHELWYFCRPIITYWMCSCLLMPVSAFFFQVSSMSSLHLASLAVCFLCWPNALVANKLNSLMLFLISFIDKTCWDGLISL